MRGERPRSSALEWDLFFKKWPRDVWFKGSSLFWQAGIAHAGLGARTYNEYRGRLFAMFRDPRLRGVSPLLSAA